MDGKWSIRKGNFNKNEEIQRQKSIQVVLFSMLCILVMPLVIGTSISSRKASPDLIAFVSETTIHAWKNTGVLPYIKVKSRIRFKKSVFLLLHEKKRG